MPKFTIDAPEGAPPAAKQKMLAKITEALDEAYHIPDIRGWLHEYPEDNASQNGRTGTGLVRPVCSLDAPELTSLDAKHKLVQKIGEAITTAYQGLADTSEIVVLIRQYPHANQGVNQVFSARPG
jgi:phenylpyruvate tautomerase PptA (4-oxalocrotonate tautomerase family)